MSVSIKRRRTIVKALWIVAAIVICVPVVVRISVYLSVRSSIYSNPASAPQSPVALVLGTKAMPGGVASPRLASRVDKAVELYKAGKVTKLLMSGDGTPTGNNEPEAMKAYAISRGVPEADIITDPAGLRTYDSVYRAKHVYGLESVTIVSQGFHLGRSLMLCRSLGVKACGVPADLRGEPLDQLRECPACLLALGDALRKPVPKN